MENQTNSSGAEWLTVKQFAVASSCTTQAVYKRLATSLQPYCKQENGRTFIHSDALSLQPVANLQPVDNPLQTEPPTAEAAALAALREQISRQAAELDAVREQLEAVRAELAASQATCAQLTAEKLAADAAAAEAIRRAEASEQREREAAATSAATITAITDALTTAQRQAETLTEALTAAQALQAGQLQLAMKSAEAEPDQPAGDADNQKRGLLARLFRRS